MSAAAAAQAAPAPSIEDEMKEILKTYNNLRTDFMITDTLKNLREKKIHVFQIDKTPHKIGQVYTDYYNNIFTNPEQIQQKIEYVTNYFVNNPETYRSVKKILKDIVKKEAIKSKCSNINNANYLNIILLLRSVKNLLKISNNEELFYPPAFKSNFLIVNFYILCYQGKKLQENGSDIKPEDYEKLCLLLCYIIIGDFLQEYNVTVGLVQRLILPDAGTKPLESKAGGKRRRSRNKRRAKTRKNLRKRSRKSKKNN